jgi:hypothetical protein
MVQFHKTAKFLWANHDAIHGQSNHYLLSIFVRFLLEQLAWYDNDDVHGYEIIIIKVKDLCFHYKLVMDFLINLYSITKKFDYFKFLASTWHLQNHFTGLRTKFDCFQVQILC